MNSKYPILPPKKIIKVMKRLGFHKISHPLAHLDPDAVQVILRFAAVKNAQKRHLEHPCKEQDKNGKYKKIDPQYEVDAVKTLCVQLDHASNLYPIPRSVTINLRYSPRLLRSILICVSTVRVSPSKS